MNVIETVFENVKIVEPDVYKDHRGFFKESHNKKVFEQLQISYEFIQDNISKSVEAGTIRGLHFQTDPKAQTKLVQVMQGVVFDVIVDLQKGSPTYKKWQGFILSEYNHRQLLVPKGYAHGFCTLVPNTIVMYKVDEHYDFQYDSGIRWNDEELQIEWPVKHPILSDKDQSLPSLKDSNHNFFSEKST
ncbi:dTDP-4-dehydrorhamnose 3,5-epimerase [Ectobacillus panaciterrae]|uniref:dTDP-4-dehydrorhamnose 3,5-epimerase n=1 Tax=Ectobacillus panaciterrae TaxID=363872 RepID=UPI000417AAD5|nr:dTDP-4-dehydrorhamnose 3,5-epimerase [Ectobacillus panaciterrae]